MSGVALDDGDPLHRASMRHVFGADRPVCLAVAHLLDGGARVEELARFTATMQSREANEKELARRWR